ncbi:HMCN1-like protein [Mya arenaria]|uniref:HMCN1-like protein n=1 Tax=Mya arenaria TaxID=6604 RepID=A0ABY7FYI3_MYAAR|nr:HMCN1-like protein [Mya arenaria]
MYFPFTVDGGWSNWTEWTQCSVTCEGQGTQSRNRTCDNPIPMFGGAKCQGDGYAMRDCTSPDKCAMWNEWGHCTESCDDGSGGGYQIRSRRCDHPRPSAGGLDCSSLGSPTDTKLCGVDPCPAASGNVIVPALIPRRPLVERAVRSEASSLLRHVVMPSVLVVDGGWGTWESWSVCDCNNELNRKRTCDSPTPVGAGKQCEGKYTQTGGWTNWFSWMACSATCGHGTRLRLRLCDNPHPENGGRYCEGGGRESNDFDGNWAEWERWSACDKPCNTGHQSRNRTCSNPEPAHGGQNCSGKGVDTTICNTQHCPVNGVWGEWGHWSRCDVTCALGNQMRNRSCDNPFPAFGGQECAGERTEFQKCQKGPCPIDGKWSGWGVWSECSVTCLNGTKSRNRTCDNPPAQYNGADCVGSYTHVDVCRPRDNCDGNARVFIPSVKAFNVLTVDSNIQIKCLDRKTAKIFKTIIKIRYYCDSRLRHLKDLLLLTIVVCSTTFRLIEHRLRDFSHGVHFSVNGGWSEWSGYTPCDSTCGTGTKMAFRGCDNPPPQHNGMYCQGEVSKSASCIVKPCPGYFIVKCSKLKKRKLFAYVKWTALGILGWNGAHAQPLAKRGLEFVHGYATNQQMRTVGNHVPVHSMTTLHLTVVYLIGVNGQLAPFPGNGTQIRSRTCTNPTPMYGGANCAEDSSEDQLCLVVNCPINGTWSDWAAWGACDVTCGNGTMTRSRSCDNPQPDFGGEDCVGNETDVTECPKKCCPALSMLLHFTCNCVTVWTETGHYGIHGRNAKATALRELSPDFGTATIHFHLVEAINVSGEYRQTDDICLPIGCSTIDGKWSGWGVWSECSVTCLNGTKSRNRTCDNPPAQYNGADCVGSFTDSDVCLPRDNCNSVKSYSSQYKSRNRTCDNPPAQYNGADCVGSYTESKVYSPRDNCGWSAWFHGPCSVTCGTGNQTRLRHCNTGHVVDCPGNKTETIACQMKPCPGEYYHNNKINMCAQLMAFGSSGLLGHSVTSLALVVTDSAHAHALTRHQCLMERTALAQARRQKHIRTIFGEHILHKYIVSLRLLPFLIPEAWSSWFNLPCSTTCGNGTRTRLRHCSSGHVDDCSGKNTDNVTCNMTPCIGTSNSCKRCNMKVHFENGSGIDKIGFVTNNCVQCNVFHIVHGGWSNWSAWSQCDVTCENGHVQRMRTCTNPAPAHGGDDCSGNGIEMLQCSLPTCPSWSAWFDGDCSVTCGVGTMSRLRFCSSGNDEDCLGCVCVLYPIKEVVIHKFACAVNMFAYKYLEHVLTIIKLRFSYA